MVCYTLWQMNALLSQLFGFVLVILIMSFGMGMIVGGSDKGKKIVSWELKQLTKFGRWILKQLLQLIADVCKWAHKKL